MKPCCFKKDGSDCMWKKPNELYSWYKGYGFEISVVLGSDSDSPEAAAKGALNSWKGSKGHNDVILAKGATWKKLTHIGCFRKGEFVNCWLSAGYNSWAYGTRYFWGARLKIAQILMPEKTISPVKCPNTNNFQILGGAAAPLPPHEIRLCSTSKLYNLRYNLIKVSILSVFWSITYCNLIFIRFISFMVNYLHLLIAI